MLKVVIDNDDISVSFSGNLKDSISYAAVIASAMYLNYTKESLIIAELFKSGVMALVGDPKSPVWKLDNQEDGNKSVEIKIPDGFQMPGDE
jgi:hypothetical protein